MTTEKAQATRNLVGDVHNPDVREGIHKLIGAVIGESIKPDTTKRYVNGRMNRPEERGGETKAWLASDDGRFWLKLAKLTGVINPATIIAIADNPEKNGYDGNNKWAE